MQAEFIAALLDPARPAPQGLIAPDGTAAGRRFSVYRNNVAVSLTEALRATFPVIEALLGAEYFAALAGVFLREAPPDDRRLMLYGAGLPGFLERFPPLAHLPFLADVARLELALGESYHAADADPIAPERLAAVPPDAFIDARLHFAPSLRLIRSKWPVLSIWTANQPDSPLANVPKPDMSKPEATLVLRPGFDPVPHPLPHDAATFIAALLKGATVGAALEMTPGLDLNATLGLLIGQAAITDLTLKDTL